MKTSLIKSIITFSLLIQLLAGPTVKEQKEKIDLAIKNSYNPITIHAYEELIRQDSTIITVDTREVEEVPKGFIPNSILISFDLSYWYSRLIKPDQKIILVTRKDREKDSIFYLAKNGLVNILGYLEGGFENWKENGKEYSQIEKVNIIDNIQNIIDTNSFILDVREKSEWEAIGILKNSTLMSLSDFKDSEKIQNLLKHLPDKEKEIYIICGNGPRTIIAGSLLKKFGVKNKLISLQGGIFKLKDNNFPLDAYASSPKTEL